MKKRCIPLWNAPFSAFQKACGSGGRVVIGFDQLCDQMVFVGRPERNAFPRGEGIAFHHPYKHQLICSVGRRKKLPATQAGSPEARNSCNFSVVSEIAHINDRLAQKCALVPPEWDAHQRLLLEEKLSREARLMWCYRGTFSPKCPDHRNCVPHTTSAPGCGLGHLLLKEKAWALPRQWNQRTAVIR